MSPETVNAIKDALAPLAQKLNESAEFVFKAYVLHAYAFGIGLLIAGVIALIVAIITMIWLMHNWSELEDDMSGAAFFGPVGVTVGLVAGVAMVSTGVMHLIAPQYYAIHDLLCTVKDCTK